MAVLEGTIVADKYEVISRIGEGGMGEVFRARQTALGRDVALKLLKEVGQMSGEPFKRFVREAKILGALKHRNLVSCYEFGEWRGTAYMAMECIGGHSLMSELVSNRGLEATRVLSMAQQIVAALECAHAAGVTHRDLKPDNVMLCADESGSGEMVKLIDFGLARLLPHDGKTMTKLTHTGFALGSVGYMAPEQCLGFRADERSDVYSLGAVMYHALRGRAPFHAENPVAMMHMHLNDDPPAIERDDLPAGLEHVVRRCLAKDPAERYQSATKLGEALDMVAQGGGEAIPSFTGSPWNAPQRAASTAEPEAAPRTRRRMLPALLVFAMLAIGTALALRPHPVPEPRKASVSAAASTELPEIAKIRAASIEAYFDARKLLVEGDYLKARDRFSEAARLTAQTGDPTDRKMLSVLKGAYAEHMAFIHSKTKTPPDEKPLLALIPSLGGHDASLAKSMLAKIYGDQGQLAKAEKVLQPITVLANFNDSVAEPYWAKAQIALRRGDVDGMESNGQLALSVQVLHQHICEGALDEPTELKTIAEKRFGDDSDAVHRANSLVWERQNR